MIYDPANPNHPHFDMPSQEQGSDVLGCGCCRGPEDDRCCCWMHQDTPRGLVPHKCSRHR